MAGNKISGELLIVDSANPQNVLKSGGSLEIKEDSSSHPGVADSRAEITEAYSRFENQRSLLEKFIPPGLSKDEQKAELNRLKTLIDSGKGVPVWRVQYTGKDGTYNHFYTAEKLIALKRYFLNRENVGNPSVPAGYFTNVLSRPLTPNKPATPPPPAATPPAPPPPAAKAPELLLAKPADQPRLVTPPPAATPPAPPPAAPKPVVEVVYKAVRETPKQKEKRLVAEGEELKAKLDVAVALINRAAELFMDEWMRMRLLDPKSPEFRNAVDKEVLRIVKTGYEQGLVLIKEGNEFLNQAIGVKPDLKIRKSRVYAFTIAKMQMRDALLTAHVTLTPDLFQAIEMKKEELKAAVNRKTSPEIIVRLQNDLKMLEDPQLEVLDRLLRLPPKTLSELREEAESLAMEIKSAHELSAKTSEEILGKSKALREASFKQQRYDYINQIELKEAEIAQAPLQAILEDVGPAGQERFKVLLERVIQWRDLAKSNAIKDEAFSKDPTQPQEKRNQAMMNARINHAQANRLSARILEAGLVKDFVLDYSKNVTNHLPENASVEEYFLADHALNFPLKVVREAVNAYPILSRPIMTPYLPSDPLEKK